jgi:hypothetical protein
MQNNIEVACEHLKMRPSVRLRLMFDRYKALYRGCRPSRQAMSPYALLFTAVNALREGSMRVFHHRAPLSLVV